MGAALAGFVLLGNLIKLETALLLIALLFVAAALGVALYHGAFGFTGGWHRVAAMRRPRCHGRLG